MEMWPKVREQLMYVVKTDDNLFYVESPDDQGLTVHDIQETLIRLFLTKEEGEIYKTIIQDYLGVKPEKLAVVSVGLQQLFEVYPKANEASKGGYGCPIKLVICTVKEDEFPEIVDTIISNTAIHH